MSEGIARYVIQCILHWLGLEKARSRRLVIHMTEMLKFKLKVVDVQRLAMSFQPELAK